MSQTAAQQPSSQFSYMHAVSSCMPDEVYSLRLVVTGPARVGSPSGRPLTRRRRAGRPLVAYSWRTPASCCSPAFAANGATVTARAVDLHLRIASRPAPVTHPAGTTQPSARELGQFYTQDDVAAWCLTIFETYFELGDCLMVEPSAGKGAFLKILPLGSLGYDPYPKWPGIVEADFLSVELPDDRRIAIIGNPPYGRRNGLARRHFNHAARWAEVIAMILPRSFMKASVQDKLDRRFRLLREELLPDNAFVFEGKPYDVPTVFQIWVLADEERPTLGGDRRHADFEFTKPAQAHFTVRRNGANAGELGKDLSVRRPAHYFVRVLRGDVDAMMDNMRKLDFVSVAEKVAGPRSIAQAEIVSLYREWLAKTPLADHREGSGALTGGRVSRPRRRRLKRCSIGLNRFRLWRSRQRRPSSRR